MVTEKRRTRTVVRHNLLEDVCSFNFFKAVHLLEGYGGGRPLGKRLSPGDDPVRFRVKPGFSFPASDILSIQNGNVNPDPVMTVNFMGLIGPKGVLPNWYNAYAQEMNHKKDFALTDFLDLFHHRILSLFYLAWKKYRLPENYLPDGSDPISQSLSGFIGMGDQTQKADPDFSKMAKKRLIYFAGLVSRSVPTATAIETIIGNATDVPVRVKQFVERMIPIHEQDRTCLGKANSTLKKDALCGGRIRDVASFFSVELGPISWEKYLEFQPRGRNLALIRKIIAFIVGLEYEFDIKLILKGPEIPSLKLGGGKRGNPVLGRTVLLKRPGRAYQKSVVVKEIT
ncbi:MAG: type VI secretion system baseplate subunit TssG [Desulfobacteraceae bacterium]|jgi:type VI secretion system protein ImpH